MIYPDFLAALARERSAAFPAEAETARRARQTCPTRPLTADSSPCGSLPCWPTAGRPPPQSDRTRRQTNGRRSWRTVHQPGDR
jgi:hypothetical protein